MAERGSAMLLIPTLTLVVLLLGAIAVDLTVVQLAHRQAVAAASGAANDAATYGLDPGALHEGGTPRLDPSRARRAAEATLAGEQALDPTSRPVVEVEGTTVRVTVRLRVEHVFAHSIPGASRSTTVQATATADAVER